MATPTAEAPAGKEYRRGTHRTCHPGETFERFRPHMERCGITRLANITGLDTVGVPVYIATRPNSRALSTSQGKGLDPVAARTSALMESLESWHGERVLSDGHYLRAGEVQEVHGLRTVDLHGLPRRGAGERWMTQHRLNWVRGTNLVDGEDVMVPYDVVSCDFTGDPALSPLIRTTNGLASGNTFDEALLHALYEVVERDAVNLWSQTAGDGDRVVAPATVTDEYNAELLTRLADSGLEVLIRWVPSDTGIPVISVTLAPGSEWRTPPYAAFSGYGAHLNPGVALARAATEAVQSRLTMIHGGRDDLWPSEYARVLDHRAAGFWARHVGSTEPTTRFDEVPDRSTDAFPDDLARVVEMIGATATATEIVAVDLTREDLGVPVVRAVVPGFAGIPFDARPRAGGRSAAGTGEEAHA